MKKIQHKSVNWYQFVAAALKIGFNTDDFLIISTINYDLEVNQAPKNFRYEIANELLISLNTIPQILFPFSFSPLAIVPFTLLTQNTTDIHRINWFFIILIINPLFYIIIVAFGILKYHLYWVESILNNNIFKKW